MSNAVESADRDRAPRYHHGDLREALVAATDAILTESGLEGFSLREAARRAGVSPAAPAHHFTDSAGLLCEVAARGFEQLKAFMLESEAGATDPRARVHGQGLGYLRFALANPGRFRLMFNQSRLGATTDRLRGASHAAHVELKRAVGDYLGDDPASARVATASAGYWSLVHGFAHLTLEGKLGLAGADPEQALALLGEVLRRQIP